MLIQKTLCAWILFVCTQSLCAIPLQKQFSQVGYAEICDEDYGSATYDFIGYTPPLNQKKFRKVLAAYRQAYLYKKVIAAVGEHQNKAEARLLRRQGRLLQGYKQLYGDEEFVKEHFKRLKKFKHKEVRHILHLIKKGKK